MTRCTAAPRPAQAQWLGDAVRASHVETGPRAFASLERIERSNDGLRNLRELDELFPIHHAALFGKARSA